MSRGRLKYVCEFLKARGLQQCVICLNLPNLAIKFSANHIVSVTVDDCKYLFVIPLFARGSCVG